MKSDSEVFQISVPVMFTRREVRLSQCPRAFKTSLISNAVGCLSELLDQAFAEALAESESDLQCVLDQFAAAAEKFVAKVESGRAKSRETYAELKAALAAKSELEAQ